MSLLKRKTLNGSDNFQTPEWPIGCLFDYILTRSPKYFDKKVIWEPACGKGRMLKYLRDWGGECIGTDILNGIDFLKDLPKNKFDLIITNPPYSKKTEFLKRCYELKKPFALLLPYSTFETNARQELFKKYGLQVLYLPRRVDFEYEDGQYKNKPWFATAWFTWGFNFNKDIIFLE